ncbi:protein-L-isoaspartate(D-aspartate) O-methyltransferase [Actinomadura rubrisoli]|uniref:Protein-L-isoaspartate O-methyltransferase n=1 Tax=Actinomadura rubrisoli TaxID=2530368 RepID=A0A4R4ZRP5_9ACTN|nr:protein-L-isoaspartate(D-aspartate) O-methyltransferase [Actinomadura rubrisoli]TDD61708.1 protein-L-isoaspartate(D-aspartate) O-methyltransferase [Actinomadura rubrisoli]
MSDPVDERLEALITSMEAKDYLPDPASQWANIVRSVPRHLFVPDRGWVFIKGGSHSIDRAARPDEWWNAVYSDAPIVTQADDGTTDHTTGEGQASSSLSALSGVLYNLRHLDLDDDHRVLEIGTGTGYTAALTVHRAGDGGHVTTVEIDPELAKQAEVNLRAALGTEDMPELVTEDGAQGYPDSAPYDRVHVTCSVQEIPYPWVEQTRPGGTIVCPFGSWLGWGVLAQVEVLPDGTGIGRFPGTSGYMYMRSQRPVTDHPAEWSTEDGESTRINPRTIAYAPAAADLVMSVLAPGVTARRPDDALWLFDGNDPECWTIATFAEHENVFEVQQHGERRLWDEVTAAYFTWVSWGRPDLSRFGLTVTPDGQQVWIDQPENVIT